VNHAEEHLRIVSCRRQVTDGAAGSGDVRADVLPGSSDVGDALDLVGDAHLGVEGDFRRLVDGDGVGRAIHDVIAIEVDHAVDRGGTAERTKPQGIHHPVRRAALLLTALGPARGLVAKFAPKLAICHESGRPSPLAIAVQIGDGGLEQADGKGSVVNAKAVVHGDELEVVGGIEKLRRHVGVGGKRGLTCHPPHICWGRPSSSSADKAWTACPGAYETWVWMPKL